MHFSLKKEHYVVSVLQDILHYNIVPEKKSSVNQVEKMDQVEAYLSNVTNRTIGSDHNNEDHNRDHVAVQIESVSTPSRRTSLGSLEDIPRDNDQSETSSGPHDDDGFVKWMPENKILLNNPSALLSRPLPNVMGGSSRLNRSTSFASNDQMDNKINSTPSHRKNEIGKGSFASSISISPPLSPMYIPVYASARVSSPIYTNTYNRQAVNSRLLSSNSYVPDNEEIDRQKNSLQKPKGTMSRSRSGSSNPFLEITDTTSIEEGGNDPNTSIFLKENERTESEINNDAIILNHDNNSTNDSFNDIQHYRNDLTFSRESNVNDNSLEMISTRQSYHPSHNQSIDSTATISTGSSNTIPSNASSPRSISSELHNSDINYHYHGRAGNMYQRLDTSISYNSLSLLGRSRFSLNIHECQRHCLLRWRMVSRHPAFRLAFAIVFFLILYYQFLWSIARISGVYDQKASDVFAMALYSIIG